MTRRIRIGMVIWIVYLLVFILVVFLLPPIYPGIRSYSSFFPFFFFFPFFLGGSGFRKRKNSRQNNGNSAGNNTASSNTGSEPSDPSMKADYQDQHRTSTYDEYGVPVRRYTSRYWYYAGFAIIVAGIILLFFRSQI